MICKVGILADIQLSTILRKEHSLCIMHDGSPERGRSLHASRILNKRVNLLVGIKEGIDKTSDEAVGCMKNSFNEIDSFLNLCVEDSKDNTPLLLKLNSTISDDGELKINKLLIAERKALLTAKFPKLSKRKINQMSLLKECSCSQHLISSATEGVQKERVKLGGNVTPTFPNTAFTANYKFVKTLAINTHYGYALASQYKDHCCLTKSPILKIKHSKKSRHALSCLNAIEILLHVPQIKKFASTLPDNKIAKELIQITNCKRTLMELMAMAILGSKRKEDHIS